MVDLVENQFPWMDMETEMLLGTGDNPDILIYFKHDKRMGENKEKGRGKEGKEKETEIR